MNPIRIKLEGFMSYRHEAELNFEDKPIWVLTGDNGSGKSAIFDAVTFALYGKTQRNVNNSDMINIHADQFLIEFDFKSGKRVYRLRKTVPRKGRATYQVIDLDTREPVPDTSSKVGFDTWIANEIGIDLQTFTASVLLGQGNSDLLIRENPVERHKMLTQIVDLSAYQRLFELADNKRKISEMDRHKVEGQVENFPLIDQSELDQISSQIGEQTTVMEQLQKRQVHLSTIAVQAQQWARLLQQKSQIIRSMGDAKAVIDNVDQIEENGQRFDYLSKYLPKLSKLAKDRQNLTQIDSQIQKNTQLIEQSTTELDEFRKIKEQLEKKRSQVKDYSSLLTEAKTLSAEANRLLGRFRTLDGKSACDSCGQPLTADHFETERQRREQVLNERQKNERQLQVQHNQSVLLRTKLEKDQKATEDRILKVESRLRENQSGLELLASKKEMITQVVTDLLAETPADMHHLNADKLLLLQTEYQSLKGADRKLEQLRQVQLAQQKNQIRLEQVVADMAEIPDLARVDAGQLQLEVQQVERRSTELSRKLESMRLELEKKKQQRHQHQKLKQQLDKISLQAGLYKDLSTLLGRDKLQRYLLRQAELGIVENANRVLDRISSGTIRLSLRQEYQDADSGQEKALDLVAHNSNLIDESGSSTSNTPIPVSLLSGSQRFRVSVALALGIGQYTSKHKRNLDTVIIDEGFGSLDEAGRRELVDELQNLTGLLDRIILVTHQEEIARAFPNGYQIRLEDESSKVSLIE